MRLENGGKRFVRFLVVYCTLGLDGWVWVQRHCKVGRKVYHEVCFLGRMSEERRWCYVCLLVQGEGARYAALYSFRCGARSGGRRSDGLVDTGLRGRRRGGVYVVRLDLVCC